jgi:putative ABC transport system permease protein
MIKNYLKIALRNLWRHRIFSFINIMGLAVGMSACFLIFLYVRFELSYDSFHSKADRIYRVVCDIRTPTETLKFSVPSWAMPKNIAQEFPEVESFARTTGDNVLIRKGNIKFQEENSQWADSTLFTVFDFKLLKGNPRTALREPLSVVFTETAAKKYFGDANPIGQSLLITGDGLAATVTGVMKDIPENSQIKGDVFLSMTTLTQKLNPKLEEQWGNFGAVTFLLLKPGTSPKALEAKFPAFLQKRDGDGMKNSKMFYTLSLEPLRDVYLHSTRDGSKTGNMNNVYIFSIVAVFILLIACFNFVNLTTARSAERAKEVGIRKVVGAAKGQLASQFIGESVIICLIAFLLSVGACVLLLPLFNNMAGKIISPGIFSNLSYLGILLLAAVGVGLLAGTYPALVLSSFKPVVVLKGRFVTGVRGILLRKSLVVIQFTLSIGLIIATIIVYTQMRYMRSQDLGFNKDQMMVIDTQNDAAKEAFRNSVAGIPNVKSVSMSSSVPGGGDPTAYSQIENIKGEMQIANLELFFVDFDYVGQFGIRMIAGRSFSRDFGTDTTQAMILNEAAVKMFGYSSPQQAVGKKFSQWGREGKIIGVMKDFHFRSLQEEIKPLSMRIEPGGCNLLCVKVAADNLPSTIASVEKKWQAAIPNRPFSYFFLDEFFDKQYRSEERFGKLFLNFAILAIFISCLGLLGLASYSTIQRTKEIGVRKVIGASVGNIVNLLSRDFILLIGIAFLIASPLIYFFMKGWLRDFAYRVPISWWMFVLAGLLALVIALATISFQAIRAAVANPVKSLRTE